MVMILIADFLNKKIGLKSVRVGAIVVVVVVVGW